MDFVESLIDLAFEEDPAVIGVVQKALAYPDVELGRAAIDLLEDYDTPEVLPALRLALQSEDEMIRISAVPSLARINHPCVSELLAMALNDTSEQVRAAALEAIQEHEDPIIQLSVLEKGIHGLYEDVKSQTVMILDERSDHRAMEILIQGLDDPSPAFREHLNETLYFLIEKEFNSYKEARKWWAENKHNYDTDLAQIEDK
jgi:HEAT repeat protein